MRRKDHKTDSRKNGWSYPPHPQQGFAWTMILMMAIVHNTCLVPGLPASWQPAGYIIPGLATLCHIVCHIISSSIDPTDPAVLRKKNGKKAVFDRSKHRHVIEDYYCRVCESDVGSRSKHCRVCNRCVSDFDHHCEWLNNCIGGRNYRWFFVTVLTAIIMFLMYGTISAAEFTAYFTDRENRLILHPYTLLNSSQPYTDAEMKIFYLTVIHEVWLVLLGFIFTLSLIGAALLTNLFRFHCYLIWKGLSTYDFIKLETERERRKEWEAETKKNKQNQITTSEVDKSKAKSEHMTEPSKVSKTSMLSSAKSSIDSQKTTEDVERQEMTEETPPPSTVTVDNNNNFQIINETAEEKLKKKKTRKTFTDETASDSSDIADSPGLTDETASNSSDIADSPGLTDETASDSSDIADSPGLTDETASDSSDIADSPGLTDETASDSSDIEDSPGLTDETASDSSDIADSPRLTDETASDSSDIADSPGLTDETASDSSDIADSPRLTDETASHSSDIADSPGLTVFYQH